MIANAPAPGQTRDTSLWGVVAWALLIAFGARIVAGQGSAIVVLGWMIAFLFLAPLFLRRRMFLATIFAVAIFIDQSLWFYRGEVAVLPLYEHPGANVKPPELLLLAGFIRLALVDRALITWDGRVFLISALWILTTLMGLAVGLLNDTSLRDMAIYSEARSPVVLALMLWLLFWYIRADPAQALRIFAVLLIAQLSISALSWTTGVSLLWQSYAPNYVGGWNAFFGADESVKIATLGLAVGLGAWIGASGRLQALDLSRRRVLWIVLTALCALAVIASARRGGYLHVAAVLFLLFLFLSTGKRLLLAAVLSVACVLAAVPLSLGVGSQTLASIETRLTGQGSVAQSDQGRYWDYLQGRDHVENNFLWGTGPGTRLPLWRVQARGEVDSLSVHSSILHVWIRFGLLGVITLHLTYLVVILSGLRRTMARARASSPGWHRAIVVAFCGFLVGNYAWDLFVPPFYVGFRPGFVVIFAVAMICALTPALRTQPRAAPVPGGAPLRRGWSPS